MFNFNIDLAVECVKSITDKSQCVTCDKLTGPCVRFPCGHTVCEDCAEKTGECLFCVSSPATYQIDKPQTARKNKVAKLLTSFQEAFKIDVYKRQRISDQQKLEKLLFPECIQAANKYSNKRKSQITSLIDKENISPKVIPGENIEHSDIVIMKKTVQYVQNWLNQHEDIPQYVPRRPFGDININTHSSSILKSFGQKTKQDVVKLKNVQTNAKKSTYKKRSHLKSIYKTESLLSNMDENNRPHRLELKQEMKIDGNSEVTTKCDKNESGIVLDDEAIVIEDTDINIIDKDEQAWLAVLEAAKRDDYKEQDENNVQNEILTNNIVNVDDDIYKIHLSTKRETEQNNKELRILKSVLFYKRSPLLETCKLCNDYFKINASSRSKINKTDDISIVINNSAFITSIKFSHCEANKKPLVNKNSVAIQTDEKMVLLKHELANFDENLKPQKRKNVVNNDSVPRKILKSNNSQSLDVFATNTDTKQNSFENLVQPKCLVIEESDTDSNVSCENTQEVEVEVHRVDATESVQSGILRTLTKEEYKIKTKRQKRGLTPNSSNSSDKENLDPNRKKMVKLGKKRKYKK